MSRVVFLDFDGVLVPIPANGEYDEDAKPSAEAIKNLNIVTQLAGAAVVVSSSWRLLSTVAQLTKVLRSWGYTGQVRDKTPANLGYDRGAEVAEWLSKHPDVSTFVILDDDPTDFQELAKNLVLVKPDVGLQFHDAVEAIRILNGEGV